MSKAMPKGGSGRPVGMKDIARALGVSIGTVDRALHGKPEVNALTRANVLRMAESLGYRPNLAARYLSSGRSVRISVHLPRELALFWDSLRKGIRDAAAPFGPALDVDFRTYPRLGQGDVPLLEEALRAGTSGLIIAPGNPAALSLHLQKAARQGIPVVCVVTDAPAPERLTSVSADPYTVGALAGELLSRFHRSDGTVAFFTGWLSTQDHADKLRGFEASLQRFGSSLRLGPVVEAHDQEHEAYTRAVDVFRAHPNLSAVYVSTVNSLPVLRAAEEAGRLSRLVVVTTDLFPELVERIRTGAVAATVYQRPLTQGRLALQALYQFLLNGTPPRPRLHVVPHLVMRSNLELLLEQLPVELEGVDPSLESSPSDAMPAVRAPSTLHSKGRRGQTVKIARG